MARRWAVVLGWTWLFLVFGGAVGPVAMAVEVRPTPTPGSLEPPVIIGVNPNPVYGESEAGEAPGGVVPGPGFSMPVPGGKRVAPPPGARRLPGGGMGKPVPDRAVSLEEGAREPCPLFPQAKS